MTQIPRVVIVGGGFAGLRVALRLARYARKGLCAVTLIDRSDVHVNPAVLYEVATALNPYEREGVGRVLHETASVPFSRILHGTGVEFLQRNVEIIDPKRLIVRFVEGDDVKAEMIVIAVGSQLKTFNIPGVETHAFSVHGLHAAVELRHHLVWQFLRYRSATKKRQEQAFRVVLVGGGAAGVELAAELILFLKKLARLHRVPASLVDVRIIEASDMLLRECTPWLRRIGLERLRSLGVRIAAKTSVCGVGADHVVCPGNAFIPTDTVVWLAGIRAHDLLLRSGFPVHPRGGVYVERTLEVKGSRNVFAAGDCVFAEDPETKRVAPDVISAALQQGNVVAHNIIRRLEGKTLVSYIYRPRPTCVTVGGKYALVQLFPFQFAGWFGWALKQLVELKYALQILEFSVALRTWSRSVRVQVAND